MTTEKIVKELEKYNNFINELIVKDIVGQFYILKLEFRGLFYKMRYLIDDEIENDDDFIQFEDYCYENFIENVLCKNDELLSFIQEYEIENNVDLGGLI